VRTCAEQGAGWWVEPGGAGWWGYPVRDPAEVWLGGGMRGEGAESCDGNVLGREIYRADL
jgi:hypothetical protein